MHTKYVSFSLLTIVIFASQGWNCVGADATGLAPGVYTEGADGKFHAVTNVNVAALWPGVWKEDTNGFTAIPQVFDKSAGTICLALPHGRDE